MPLIGRDRELSLLDQAYAAAVAGRPSLVLVGGEAGVGKSALAGETAGRVRAAGGLALTGGCLELAAGAVPFLPIVEALGALPRELGPRAWQRLVADSPPQLGWLLPGTVTAPDLGPLDPLATATARMQILDLLLALVRRLAAERPVALVVEDVHWADASTRDLLAFLSRALRDDRVLLIATFRAEAVDADERLRGWLAQLGRRDAAVRLALAPLTPAELERYLGDVLGHAPDPALAADVHRRCGGNPFMAQELVRAGGAGLPATLRDALLARIGALPPAAVDVVRWAAAAGGRVDHRLLAAVAGLGAGELAEALREAVRGAVLVADHDAARWAFRHDLLHEAAYDELLPGEREARHRALARALEADPGAGGTRDAATAAIAGHWFAARDPEAALGAAVRAAAAAARLRAYPEAHQLLERALALWPEVDDGEALAGATHTEVTALAAEAAALGDELERALELSAAPELVARLRPVRGWWLMVAGRSGDALAAYEAARRDLPPEGSEERAWTLALHALGAMLAGRPATVPELVAAAIAAARAAGVPAAESIARTALGTVVAGRPGGEARGIAELERGLALARETGAAEAEVVALINITHALGRSGRLEEAVAVALAGAERCRLLGLERRGALFLDGNAAELLEVLGRWDEAERLVTYGLDLAPEGLTAVHLRIQEAVLAIERGDPGRALAALKIADALGAAEAGDHFRTGLEATRAAALTLAGRPADALPAAQMALAAAVAADDPHAAATALRAGTAAAAETADGARARRDEDTAAAARAAGRALWDDAPACAWPPRTIAAGDMATAEAERDRLDGRADPEAWERAAAAWRAIPAPGRAAAAELRRAEALLAAGAPRPAIAEALTVAHEVACDLGAHGIQREAARLAARARVALGADAADTIARGAPRVPEAAGRLGVTARELEVLALVAAGRTNRQIADELVLSIKTVGVHVSNLLRKLGATTRGEAGAIARRAGLVDEETLDRLLDADPR